MRELLLRPVPGNERFGLGPFFRIEPRGGERRRIEGLVKDATVGHTEQAIEIARGIGYGVTGNFVSDPAWPASDFERLWDFVDLHGLHQAGFTILTRFLARRTSKTCVPARGAQVGRLRHAPLALGAGARRREVF
jgi:hypothetical protein